MRNEIGFHIQDFFSHDDLMNRFDNPIRKQQRNGHVTESHNTLSIEDLRAIFTYLNKAAIIGQGYRGRLEFSVVLATGLRPTALHTLTVGQLGKRDRPRGSLYNVLLCRLRSAGRI